MADQGAHSSGLFFSSLRFTTPGGKVRIKGLAKPAAAAHFVLLQRNLLAQLEPIMANTAAEIQQLLNAGYPKASRLSKVVFLARQAVARFQKLPAKTDFRDINFTPFEVLLFQA